MTKEQITVKDILHLYLGCDCISYYRTKDGSTGEDIVVELNKQLIGVDMYGNAWLSGNIRISDFKLKLRPLSSMTEEEAKEMGFWSDLHNCITGIEEDHAIYNLYTAEQFRMAISKHFDLFGLIPSGLAIDATTINNLNQKP